jgi:hypothetical protein
VSVDARGWKRTRGGLPGAVRYVAIADHSSDSAHWPGARTRGCRIGDSALCTFRGWWRFMRSKQKASTQWHKRRAGIAKNSLPVPVKVDGKRTPGGAAGEPGHTLCRSPTPNLLQSCKSKFQVLVQVESPPFRLPRRVASRERKYATALTAVYTRRVCSIESAAIAAFEDV